MEGIIFDMDGTLIDSMKEWYQLAPRYLKTIGYKASSEFVEQIEQLTLPEAAKLTIDTYNLNLETEELISIFTKMMEEEYMTNIPLKEGVMDFIVEAHKRNIKMYIATNTNKKLAVNVLERLNLLQYLEGVVTCECVGVRKHRPDVYDKALELLGTKKEETYIFEDALYAIKTAKAANYKVVGVYDEIEDDKNDEIRKLVDIYIDSFKEWTW